MVFHYKTHTVALYYREVNNDITLFLREELMRNLSNRVFCGVCTDVLVMFRCLAHLSIHLSVHPCSLAQWDFLLDNSTIITNYMPFLFPFFFFSPNTRHKYTPTWQIRRASSHPVHSAAPTFHITTAQVAQVEFSLFKLYPRVQIIWI